MTLLDTEGIAFIFIKPMLHCLVGRLSTAENGARTFRSGKISIHLRHGEYVQVGKAKGLFVSIEDKMSFAHWLALEDNCALRAFQGCRNFIDGDINDESHFMALMTATFWVLESGFGPDSRFNEFFLDAGNRGYRFHREVSAALSGGGGL